MTPHPHPRGGSRRPPLLWRTLAIGPLLGAAAVILTGCGSHIDTLTPSQQAQIQKPLIAYANCMRRHGVSDFHDPSISSTGGIGYSNAQVQAIDRGDRTYQTAETACENLPGATTAERLLKQQ
jgi:hypothetical protein